MYISTIATMFEKNYLRTPNAETQSRSWHIAKIEGYLKCLEVSIVCAWKNYSFAHQVMYKDHKGLCNVVLEAVADQDLWICHAFLVAGSHNNINVLQYLNVF
jgi:hypothetical protein